MKLCLKEHESYPIHLEQEFSAEHFGLKLEGLLSLGPGRVLLSIQKTEQEFFCQGSLRSKAHLECSRCLEPYDTELAGELDFIACGLDHYESLKSEAADDEDYVFIDSSDMTVDITAPVQQALILAISMKPLCSDGCRGICSRCGKNLNKTDCDCNSNNNDHRWDALRGMNGG